MAQVCAPIAATSGTNIADGHLRSATGNGPMIEKKAKSTGGRMLSELIRKEFCSQANRRFLARMPPFRPQAELPERFSMLLAELDRAESRARRTS